MAIESINTIKSYLTEGKYPTASELVNVIDTLVSIGQNSGGDTSGLAAVAISGDYNDLTNKPTVPAISTNITSDATSDTKTASPKAVKDFVEGKGYLTQHQDISGKADQTDLEALEDRVETLEQGGSGGGDTTQYSYLKLIDDLDAYTEAPVGEIVKYIGQTNDKYTRGWDYECVADSSSVITIPAGTKSCWLYNNSAIESLGIDKQFYVLGTEQFNYAYNSSTGGVYWKQNAVVGDYALWQDASNVTSYKFCRIIEILDNGIKYEYPTSSGYRTATLHTSSPWTYNKLVNADGIILYYWSNTIGTGTINNIQIVDWDNQKSYYPTSVQVSQTTEDITIGTPAISWQLILMPTASN